MSPRELPRMHPPTTAHNYVPKLLAVAPAIARRGDVTHVHITHDDWCDALAGGFCNCDPDIVVSGESN